MMKNMKIEYKIWLAFMLIALFTIATAFGLTHYLHQKLYVERQIDLLLSYGRSLSLSYQTDEQAFQEQLAWSNDHMHWETIYTDNPMLLSGHLPFEKELGENLISFEERQSLLAGDELILVRQHEKFNQDILAVVIPLMEEEQLKGAIFLYTPLAEVYEPFRPLMITVILLLLGLLALIMFVARKITRYLVGPIQSMTRVTKKISKGDFSERLPDAQKDELGMLAQSFNAMASTLQQIEQNRREFLSNVSHELRTPISFMKGFSEGFEEGLVDSEQYMQVMKRETIRLERLVHDLLDLAQLEGDSLPMQPSPLPFAQLIIDVIERFSIELKEAEIEVVSELDDRIIIYGDADRLEQVVTNLIQNAIQYGGAGKRIDIRLSATREAVLQIQDYGIGIPEQDLPKVMERFYRVDKARTRKHGGTGIGLAIVYHIIKKHQGDIAIISKPHQGTTITITLPLVQ